LTSPNRRFAKFAISCFPRTKPPANTILQTAQHEMAAPYRALGSRTRSKSAAVSRQETHRNSKKPPKLDRRNIGNRTVRGKAATDMQRPSGLARWRLSHIFQRATSGKSSKIFQRK
jgi:hypothetical protein